MKAVEGRFDLYSESFGVISTFMFQNKNQTNFRIKKN